MEKIAKVYTYSQATAYGKAALFMSLPFIGLGAFFALGGFGLIPLPFKGFPRSPIFGAFGATFFFCGSTLFVYAVQSLLNRRRIQKASKRHLNEPWFQDFPWNPHGMRDPAGRRTLGSVLKAVLFCVFLTPFNLVLIVDDPGSWIFWIVIGVFDLAMILIVANALYHLAQFLKFGYARLSFYSFPYHPGDKLVVGFSGTPQDHLKATLRFVEERIETSGSGENQSIELVCYQHYDEQKELPSPAINLSPVNRQKHGNFQSELEIAFDLPDKTEWITELSGTPVRYWELVVESEQPGIDYRTTFPLPVYGRS
jgi:hypothetical protein